MILQCLTDICPVTGKTVDMLVCCKSNKSCEHYGAKPWSEFGKVTCNHPKAKNSSRIEREARFAAFKASAGCQHVKSVRIGG